MPSDVAAIKDVLLRFSALVEDFPQIKEVEINPLIWDGEEWVAVDWVTVS